MAETKIFSRHDIDPAALRRFQEGYYAPYNYKGHVLEVPEVENWYECTLFKLKTPADYELLKNSSAYVKCISRGSDPENPPDDYLVEMKALLYLQPKCRLFRFDGGFLTMAFNLKGAAQIPPHKKYLALSEYDIDPRKRPFFDERCEIESFVPFNDKKFLGCVRDWGEGAYWYWIDRKYEKRAEEAKRERERKRFAAELDALDTQFFIPVDFAAAEKDEKQKLYIRHNREMLALLQDAGVVTEGVKVFKTVFKYVAYRQMQAIYIDGAMRKDEIEAPDFAAADAPADEGYFNEKQFDAVAEKLRPARTKFLKDILAWEIKK